LEAVNLKPSPVKYQMLTSRAKKTEHGNGFTRIYEQQRNKGTKLFIGQLQRFKFEPRYLGCYTVFLAAKGRKFKAEIWKTEILKFESGQPPRPNSLPQSDWRRGGKVQSGIPKRLTAKYAKGNNGYFEKL
jgi:hypothetical protein